MQNLAINNVIEIEMKFEQISGCFSLTQKKLNYEVFSIDPPSAENVEIFPVKFERYIGPHL